MTAVEQQVRRRINAIEDPCSCAMGVPIGLIDMGIVEEVRVDGEGIRVTVRPTFPGCIYLGHLTEQIEQALDDLGPATVRLADDDDLWDESRMSPQARARLAARRPGRPGRSAHRRVSRPQSTEPQS